MAANNQLDVYKIILKKKKGFNFKTLITSRYVQDQETNYRNSGLFNLLYKAILEQIAKEIWRHPESKIGLTLFKKRGEKENKILTSHSSEFVIEGYIDGGPYDMIRKLSNLSKTKSQNIKKDDIITDRYYIYMYFPLHSNVGVVFLQSKSNANIRTAIKEFLPEICKTDINKGCKVETYIPTFLKEEFKEGAIVQSLTYSQQFVTEVDTSDGITNHEEAYNVIIQIQPQNQTVELGSINSLLDKVGNMAIKVGQRIKPLSEFEKKKGALRNEDMKKTSPFSLDDDEKVRPVIMLDDIETLGIDEDGNFCRADLKTYCDGLLQQIYSDIYPISNE